MSGALEPRWRSQMYDNKRIVFLGGTNRFDIAVSQDKGADPRLWLIWSNDAYQWVAFNLQEFKDLKPKLEIGSRQVGWKEYPVRISRKQIEELHAYVRLFAPDIWNGGHTSD